METELPGTLLGSGRNADVYDVGGGRVLRRYRDGRDPDAVEREAKVMAHARAHGHVFDIIKDPDDRIADLLDAQRTPEAFLFDRQRTLRYHGRIASKISSPDLKNALEALLAGLPIRPVETKAFGCAIPRD